MPLPRMPQGRRGETFGEARFGEWTCSSGRALSVGDRLIGLINIVNSSLASHSYLITSSSRAVSSPIASSRLRICERSSGI